MTNHPSPARPWVKVSVFTTSCLGGNPLAVFTQADGLSGDQMQSIAREMNLSETTFLLPSDHPECAARVRIFTRTREMPFAGYPTLGTAYVLATEGLLPHQRSRFSLEEQVGPVAVEIEGQHSAPGFIWMTHPKATFEEPFPNRDEFAQALGLTERDLIAAAPVLVGSTGSPYLYIPLRTPTLVDRASLAVPRLLRAFGDRTPVSVFVFAPVDGPENGRVHSRMFAPHTSGTPEDPATGAASGPLGAYLVTHGLVTPAPNRLIISEQGTLMGRQSFVHIRLAMTGRSVDLIRVGGSVVPLERGVLECD